MNAVEGRDFARWLRDARRADAQRFLRPIAGNARVAVIIGVTPRAVARWPRRHPVALAAPLAPPARPA